MKQKKSSISLKKRGVETKIILINQLIKGGQIKLKEVIKMKKVKVCVSLFVLFMFFLLGTNANAATVGQQLKEPEVGWKRYDDTDSKIIYTGSFIKVVDAYAYNNSSTYSGTVLDGSTISFHFSGTKFRIITSVHTSDRSTKTNVVVDGNIVGSYSPLGTTTPQCLIYEITGLTNARHHVQLIQVEAGRIMLDAIDIDSTGSLIDYYQPTNLTATAGNAQVNLSWTAVAGATGYNVKRATTAGGPYTTIATSVTEAVYTDSTVTNGTTYYYVVTAVSNDGESDPSNEVSATPQDQSSGGTGGKAILVITMANGMEKEYDLTMSEINAFINWYNSRTAPYYTISKNYNLGPFQSRKDYIVQDKIVNFEVMEY
ncbi:fibronectin type III domain-containing protein [Desulforamulus aeronauticus]|uniref:Fibronectin type-III domain-containing protein n=1 Tax=Desulforamulus aeronauticus DSM 10349 TaxID=1121421 RepID=A0A1M6VBS1_9FIRM|nr:fibronectin type III domain-containing protein [Desulforamulus aeronauticus]SHK78899.1 hypothetical protein SAMN02745123_03119 [Desulforamulus aeronauticus DSM 10349]